MTLVIIQLLFLAKIPYCQWAISGDNISSANTGNVGIGTRTPTSFKLQVAGNIGPETDNEMNLGSAAQRWANIFAGTIHGNIINSGLNTGSIIFAGTGGVFSQNSTNFYWDNANRRLGIGTRTPTATIDLTASGLLHLNAITGTEAGYTNYIAVNESYKGFPNIDLLTGLGSTGNEGAVMIASSAGNTYFGTSNSVSPRNLVIQNYAGKKAILFTQQREMARFAEQTGNLLINTVMDQYTDRVLQVAGKSSFTDTAFYYSKIIISDGTQGIGKVLTSDVNGAANWQFPVSATNNSWTDAGGGNLFNTVLSGNVSVGVSAVPAGYRFAVGGGIIAEKLKLKLQSALWPDYVFDSLYQLPSLTDLAGYIKKYKHLPGIPSALEADKAGIDILVMNTQLLQKIEELTLYILAMNSEIEKLKIKK